MELTTINHLRYGPFTTEVKASKIVLDFVGEDLELTKDIDSDTWYRGWLLELDKNQDGKVDDEYGKDFELIYCGIIENPEDFLEKDMISEEIGIKESEILIDGTQPIFGTSDNKKARFWVRWIIKKTS